MDRDIMAIFGTSKAGQPATQGPEGFCWLKPGLLGGAPRPSDYAGLRRVGTGLLVSLTAEWRPDRGEIGRHGMRSLYVPIPDFQPPTPLQAMQVCAASSAFTRRGAAVVFHCHAGKGRTGTMLAAMLIWAGQTAEEAIAETRAANAAWIETEGQLAFLRRFANALA